MTQPSSVIPHPSDDLIVEQLRLGPLWNFVYLAGSRQAGEAIVIDPGAEVEPVLERAAALGLRVAAAVATHFHTDHTAGLEALVRHTGADVYIHHADEAGCGGTTAVPCARSGTGSG